MYEYEVKAAISPLKAEAQAKLRERAEAVTGVTAQVLRHVAEHLFDPNLSTGEALRRKLSVSRRGVKLAGQVLGEALRDVVTDLRIGIARRFLEEHPEAPVWRVAAEVGLPEHRKFVRYYKHHTGEELPRLLPRPFDADFDYVTFDRERRDLLRPDERARLLDYHHRLRPAPGEDRERTEIQVPKHRCGCDLHLVPKGPVRAAVLEAIGDSFYRLTKVRERLRPSLREVFDDFCGQLFSETFDFRSVHGTTRGSLGFYLGEYVVDYRHREQVQMATRLLAETSLSVGLIARVVGLSETELYRVFKSRTGQAPEARRKAPEAREPYGLWRRALTRSLSSAEADRLTAVLREPPEPRPAKIRLPGSRRQEVDLDPRYLIPDEAWEELRAAAAQLSWRNLPGARPEVERTMSVSVRAPSLYRLRQVQCVETAYRQLIAGKKPAFDPYADWLKNRRKADRKQDTPLEVWEGVVGGLADSREAFAALGDLEEKRCRLLAMPEARRKSAIEDASKGYQDYRLAWWCLIAEESFHRCHGDVVAAQGQIASWIAETLPEEMRCGVTLAAFGVASARLGNGYKIDGLVQRAHSSLAPALTTMERFDLGLYAAGEILLLHAALLLNDPGSPPQEARQRLQEAERVLGNFDPHHAAKATVLIAEAQRQEPASGYLSTLKTGIAALDRFREPRILEGSQTNLLFYLINDRRIHEFRRWQAVFSYPKDPLLKVYRAGVDGCAQILANDLDLAERLFRYAKRWATTIGRRVELISILLYLAFVRHEKRDLVGCSNYVETALAISTGFGLDQAPAIASLLASIRMRENVANRLLSEALKAGGCLGPTAEAALA